MAAIVVKCRQMLDLSPKVDDDTFVEVDLDGVVVVASRACLPHLLSSGQDMYSGLNWSPNAPP